MLQTFIIADSRHVIPQNFEVEAAFASYHRFLSNAIPKYIAICDCHSWMRRPTGLFVLTESPDMLKIISCRFLEVSIACKNLEPPSHRFAGSSSKLAVETWGSFLTVAIQKISDMINGSSTTHMQMSPDAKGRIIIYSSDILLIGMYCKHLFFNSILYMQYLYSSCFDIVLIDMQFHSMHI